MPDVDYGSIEIYSGVSIRDMQNRMILILKYFIQLCESNGLRYWCAGGTMLGAVRHKGFIPWDDDIDVFMPRSDYERLFELWPKIGDLKNYCLCRTTKDKMYHQTDMQLVDINTDLPRDHVFCIQCSAVAGSSGKTSSFPHIHSARRCEKA